MPMMMPGMGMDQSESNAASSVKREPCSVLQHHFVLYIVHCALCIVHCASVLIVCALCALCFFCCLLAVDPSMFGGMGPEIPEPEWDGAELSKEQTLACFFEVLPTVSDSVHLSRHLRSRASTF